METLVVSRPRNQYYCRSGSEGPAGFSSSPSRGLREMNCRTFESGAGILPNPFNTCTSPGAKRACCNSLRTPSSYANHKSEGTKNLSRTMRTPSLPISINASKRERCFNEGFSLSELWAGPAYSNSPHPNSLPIPKFSLRQKRAVTLDFPGSAPVVKVHPIAKSAPSSPTKETYLSPRDLFHTPDTATKTLLRILNLDITKE